MIIIKIILWVLLAVLLIAAAALMIPTRIGVRYTDDVTVVIKYLFLKFTVVGDTEEKKPKRKIFSVLGKKPKGTYKKKKKSKNTAAKNKTVASNKNTNIQKKTAASNKNTTAQKKTVASNKNTNIQKKTAASNKNTNIQKKTAASNKNTTAQKKTVASNKKVKEENISKKKTKADSRKKPVKKASKKEENAAVKWVKNTFKEKGLGGLMNAFKEIAKLAGTFLKPIFKHTRIKHLDLNVTVAFEDAAQTAINYGYFCSGIYPALAVLLRIMKYDDYSVNIAPDFDKQEPEFDVFAELSIIPWFVVFGAVHSLVNYLILKYKERFV